MKGRGVAEWIAAPAEPYERALSTIRGYAAGLLYTGYPREAPAQLAGPRALIEMIEPMPH